ncbi:hypothetical protein MPH_00072 [Macrophomina phaseolina MS6]|uniref:Uncharacterized protein n=2 Tax=Macrophomina phaseolina TaxID=35725 RepID=K2SJM1_MACPH|nr:hypothetical protein MPH_00072 [Macrophomina phaseolina MS6]
MIYELALKPVGTICLYHRIVPGANRRLLCKSGRFKNALNTTFLLLNKATLAEAGPYLYKNIFSFDNPIAMYHFLSGLSSTTKAWIEYIDLGVYSTTHRSVAGYLFPALNSLVDVKNLKGLSLHGYFLSPSYKDSKAAKHIYAEAHHWLEAVAREKGYMTAGVDLLHLQSSLEWTGRGRSTHPRAESILLELKKVIWYSKP